MFFCGVIAMRTNAFGNPLPFGTLGIPDVASFKPFDCNEIHLSNMHPLFTIFFHKNGFQGFYFSNRNISFNFSVKFIFFHFFSPYKTLFKIWKQMFDNQYSGENSRYTFGKFTSGSGIIHFVLSKFIIFYFNYSSLPLLFNTLYSTKESFLFSLTSLVKTLYKYSYSFINRFIFNFLETLRKRSKSVALWRNVFIPNLLSHD